MKGNNQELLVKMNKWKIYKLGEIVDVLGDGIHGTPIYNEVGDYYFINGNNLGEGYIKIKENTLKVDEKEYLKHKKNLTNRTLLLSINGTLGNVAKYRGEPCILGKSACYLNISESCERDFIYYIMISPLFRRDLENMATGTTIKNVSLKALRNYEISLPPLAEQKRIADILSAIDDKIELNRRINANLEQQAQALYKSWFVDNKKDDWKEVPLSEVADFVGGYSYKGNELVESSMTAMATIKNFERKGGFKVDGFKDIVTSNKLKAEHHANLFDILVAHTDLTQNADVIGNAEMLLTFDKYSDIIFSMDLVKVLPKQTFPYKYLLAALLKNPHFKKHCMGYVNGTTVLHMSKKALPEYIVNLPSIEEIQSMDNAFKAYYLKMAEILQENNSLSTLRDTLLPKLMSGEIKVPTN